MGKVVVQYDIKTPEPNYDTDKMIAAIRGKLEDRYTMQEKVEIKPLFFGIKAAVCQFVFDEHDESAQDDLENYLNGLDETGELELTYISRL